ASRVERRRAIEQDSSELAQADVAAIELTHELVIGIDDRGVVRLFNAGAEATSGYGREEMIGQKLVSALVAEESREALERALADTAKKRFRIDGYVKTR